MDGNPSGPTDTNRMEISKCVTNGRTNGPNDRGLKGLFHMLIYKTTFSSFSISAGFQCLNFYVTSLSSRNWGQGSVDLGAFETFQLFKSSSTSYVFCSSPPSMPNDVVPWWVWQKILGILPFDQIPVFRVFMAGIVWWLVFGDTKLIAEERPHQTPNMHKDDSC